MLVQLQKSQEGQIVFSLYQEGWPLPTPLSPDNMSIEALIELHDSLIAVARGLNGYLEKNRSEELKEFHINREVQDVVESKHVSIKFPIGQA